MTTRSKIEPPARPPGVLSRCMSRGMQWLAPLLITVAVLKLLVDLLGTFFSPLISWIYQHLPEAKQISEFLSDLQGVVVLLVLILLVGFVASQRLGRLLLEAAEYIIERIPVIRSIYKVAKQVVHILFPDKEAGYDRVVLIEFIQHGMYSIGFVTGTLNAPDGGVLLRVFIPTVPNPTTGFMVIIREDATFEANMSVDEAMSMILSGGIITPQSLAGLHNLPIANQAPPAATPALAPAAVPLAASATPPVRP